jgi:hypothetical protein
MQLEMCKEVFLFSTTGEEVVWAQNICEHGCEHSMKKVELW